jgi:polysaccharide pyruvyl transferase WcaK-like protein
MELIQWVEALKTLKGCHMLIVAGAGLLSDYATHPLGMPYQIFKWSIIARICRCRLLFVSVGAGPICRFLTRWFIKLALSLAHYRSYRDRFSKEYLESIGFERDSDRVYPDLAFSLPKTLLPENIHLNEERPVIGVGLLDYYGVLGQSQDGGEAKYLDFINKLGTFVTWVLEHKYIVRVLIGDVLYDSRVKQDLINLLQKRGLKYEDGQIIDEPVFSVNTLLSQLAATDVVVSPRFHNILLALMLCKPVISLSYHEKFKSVMAESGLPEYCQDIEHLNVDRLIDQFIRIEKDAENLKPYIKQKTEEFRKALDEQYCFIFNHFWRE